MTQALELKQPANGRPPLRFRLDETLCTGCGSCVLDCPSQVIVQQSTGGQPSLDLEREALCLRCQHCLAICPRGAISIEGRDPGASLPLVPSKLPTLDQMTLLIRGRRSVRQYSEENVDRALLDSLLSTLAHAPSGTNLRGLTFRVIDDRATLQRFREKVLEALAGVGEAVGVPEGLLKIMKAAPVVFRERGRDIIFRGAPHLLVVSAPPNLGTRMQDVSLHLAYFELLAQSAGLGTVWCGLLKIALELLPELKLLLELPADHTHYAMLFGHPAVRYARTAQLEDTATIHRVRA